MTMTSQAANSKLSVLFVFNGTDEDISHCGELMLEQGVRVQWVPDVYSAMAQLSTGNLPNRLIVDVRNLDDAELQFIALAPRYFPTLRLTVAVMNGSGDRLLKCKGRYETASLVELTDEALGIRTAVTADTADEAEVVEWTTSEDADEDDAVVEEGMIADRASFADADDAIDMESNDAGEAHVWPAAAEAPGDEDLAPEAPSESRFSRDSIPDGGDIGISQSRLSTDGGPESAGAELPLHELVRRRMSEAPPPSRRMPPAATFQPPAPPPEAPTESTDHSISPEEIDALLDRDVPDANWPEDER